MPSLSSLMMMAAGWRARKTGVDIFTWEEVTAPAFSSEAARRMVFADGKIAAGAAVTGVFSYSTDDAQTWSTAVQLFGSNGTANCLTYVDGTWMYSTAAASATFPKTSTDLINWTDIANAPFSSGAVQSGEYYAPYYYLGGRNGRISRSTDLVTWTKQDNGSAHHYALLYRDGVLLVASSTGQIYRSTDFSTWAYTKLSYARAHTTIAYNEQLGRVMVGSDGGGNCAYSDDFGITWAEFTISGVSNIRSILAVDGYFIVSAFTSSSTNGGQVLYSTDCVTWTVIPGFEKTATMPYLYFDGARLWLSEGYIDGVDQRLRRTVL